jgi:hypothetical protein
LLESSLTPLCLQSLFTRQAIALELGALDCSAQMAMRRASSTVHNAHQPLQRLKFAFARFIRCPEPSARRPFALTPTKTLPDLSRTLPRMLKAGKILPPQFAAQKRRSTVVPMPMPNHRLHMRSAITVLKSDEFSRVFSRPWRGAYGQRSIAQ